MMDFFIKIIMALDLGLASDMGLDLDVFSFVLQSRRCLNMDDYEGFFDKNGSEFGFGFGFGLGNGDGFGDGYEHIYGCGYGGLFGNEFGGGYGCGYRLGYRNGDGRGDIRDNVWRYKIGDI